MEGVVGPSNSQVHEEYMENYIEGMGSDIDSTNHEDEIVTSISARLHGGEMIESQRQDL